MKKTSRRALYILAALLAALFVLSCLVGFAACGGGSTEDNEVPGSSQDDDTKGDTGDIGSGDQGGSGSGDQGGSQGGGSGDSGSGSGSGDTGSGSGDTGSGGGSAVTYNNTQSFEAEDAGLFNSMELSDLGGTYLASTELMGVETQSDTATTAPGVTNVKNFNVKGDKIVYQLYASAAISGVQIDLYSWAASTGGLSGYSYATYKNFITVNGAAVEYTGSVTTAYGTPVTATASLNAGVNYIEITLEATGSSAIGMNMGGINVDRIDLSWDGEATIEEVSDYTGEVFDVDATGVATMEAEEAALMNGASSTTGTTASLMGVQTSTSDNTTVCVSNFDTTGDKIVFQVLASAAVTVQIDLVASTTYFLGTTLDVSSIPNLLSVNGTPVTLTGTLTNGAFSFYDFGTVTATGVSLSKGINYIVLDYQDNNMNVDKIDLNGGTGAEAEPEAAEVSTAEGLVEALEAGGEIVLTDNIKIGGTTAGEGTDPSTLVVSEDTELDLAGKTLSCDTGWTPVQDNDSGIRNDVMISVATGATLTVEDTSSDGSGKINYDYTGSTISKGSGSSETYAWNNSANNGAAIEVNGGKLVIESGTVESVSVGIRAKAGSVEIDGGTVYSSGYYVLWESNGTVDVTINDGVVAGAKSGILVDGDSNFGQVGSEYQYSAKTTLTVNGGVIYSGGTSAGAIRTEGMTSVESATITINGGEIISASTGTKPAIALLNGTLTITDTYKPVISGPTALEIQAGKATISGGTFVASYTEDQYVKLTTSSDSFTYGYALAIYARGCVRTTNEKVAAGFDTKVDVTVTGGTYVGDVLVSKTNAYAHNDDISSGTEGYFDRGSLKTADEIAAGNYSYVWTLNEADSEGNVNYKVDMTNSGITLTNGTVSYTGSNVSGTGSTDCLIYTYTDLTSNFVTGAYNQSAGVPEGVYTVGGNKTFTGSEVTSVVRVGTTYIVNGTTGSMTQEQAAAFYNEDEATTHIGDQYIVVAIVAGAGEQIQVKSSVDGTTYTLDGDSQDTDWTFYTLCFNVTNYDTNPDFDSLCFTIVVDGVEFDVVLGDITSATP